MRNPVRDYAWGHKEHIPRLLGLYWPKGKPAAELWMGAHSTTPSVIFENGKKIALDGWIEKQREAALGENIAREYGRLPYLFKLLAADKSLSIQAHPSKKEAEAGFERENQLGIPLNSPQRNYKDNNHKPEIIMAISPFTAMIGFRPLSEISRRFRQLDSFSKQGLFPEPILTALDRKDSRSLEQLLRIMLTLNANQRGALLAAALDTGIYQGGWDYHQCEWVPKLAGQFPDDIGALAPLFLNIVKLQPGEALYQPAKTLHAYLEGFGAELMANSDNVLRGGLTPKHVDADELLGVLDYSPFTPAILKLREKINLIQYYPAPAHEFALGTAVLDTENAEPVSLSGSEGPLIIFCLEGRAALNNGSESLSLKAGQSAFVPCGESTIHIGGRCRIVLAKPGS
ncbi:MAG: mannose-6-phosphate isomerase, class I [Spirochaeta sp. LUC14_002_19_P3]|nr:MAG: mannose-6-phosphate isomerase, class I [Spirochaeta sp. LUC14_002_19_P3]